VFGAEGVLANGNGTPIERLGLGVAAHVLVEPSEVIEVGGEAGVLGAESLLVDGDGALVEQLGLGVAACITIEPSKIVETGS
jgi:hypothetical protein